MQFSRIITAFFLFVTLGVFALATPLEKRQDTADIESILTTLQTAVASPISSLTALGASGNATDDEVEPLVNDIITALTTAGTSLTALETPSLVRRQSTSDIATLVATLVEDITGALDDVLSTPILASLLPGLDAALDNVLNELEALLAGVLTLVAVLLTDVAGILEQLALGLTLASLGL